MAINLILTTHHFRIDGNIPILIVFVFHFFISHELQCTMTHSQHARNKALKRTFTYTYYVFLSCACAAIAFALCAHWNGSGKCYRANTYSVESTDAFDSIDFGQSINHAVVTVLWQISLGTVLQTQASFNNPYRIRHDKCQNTSFSRSHHMHRRSQWCCRIALLNPCFDCVVAAIGTRVIDCCWEWASNTYNKK